MNAPVHTVEAAPAVARHPWRATSAGTLRRTLLSLFLMGCGSPIGSPTSFGDFYTAFQDSTCIIAADGGCELAAQQLDCLDRTAVPACDEFDAGAAELCLEGPTTCDGTVLQSPRACDLVCLDTRFSEIGTLQTPSCADMLACDEALAAATGAPRLFAEGQDDAHYGTTGACFENDPAGCEATCAEVSHSLREVASSIALAGVIAGVPEVCDGIGGPASGSDSDGDSYTDAEEILAGTDPRDPGSRIYAGGWPFNPNKVAIQDPGLTGSRAEGQVFPRLHLEDQHGDTVDLYDFAFQGKPIMVDVGAQWVGPCLDMHSWLSGGPAGRFQEVDNLRRAVDDGDILWITVMVENASFEPATGQTVQEWSSAFPNDRIPVLVDHDRALTEWLDLASYPSVLILNEDMTILEWDPENSQDSFQVLSSLLSTL